MSETGQGSTASSRLAVEGLAACTTSERARYVEQLEGVTHPLDAEIVAAIDAEKHRASGHNSRLEFVQIVHERLLQDGHLEGAHGRVIKNRMAELAASTVDPLSMPILIRRAVREQFNRAAAAFGRKLIEDVPGMADDTAFSLIAVEVPKLRELATRLNNLTPETALREVAS